MRLTWNNLSAERQRAEGGARLLSINTVRPFSLAAGLMRRDGESRCRFKTGAVVGEEETYCKIRQQHFIYIKKKNGATNFKQLQ